MFAPQTKNKAKTAAEGKPRRADAAIGKDSPEPNPVWQSLALNYGRIQPKLAIGQPDDPYEHEADQIADRVMRMPAAEPGHRERTLSPNAFLRAQPSLEQSGKVKLQCKEPVPNAGGPTATASPIIQEALQSPGHPLDTATRSFMERSFNRDFTDVRVHAGETSAASARLVNAVAYTVGRDIVFAAGHYRPTRSEGRLVLAHELAHVTQQSATRSPMVQRFEAPVHEAVERYGLTTDASGSAAGLSQQEASAVYFGNWMRDMNQVFVPMVVKMVGPDNIDVIYALINYLAFKKFGQQVGAEQFGYYIPAEHIDSPAGIVAEYDLLPKQPTPKTPPTGPQPPARPPQFVTQQESVAPDATVQGANIFSVDQTGVLAFVRRSNLHVERRLELAAERGRNPEGMMHFGAALHAVEDLFAHSNWVEIAVAKALKDDPKLLPELKGSGRQVFNFSDEIRTPAGKRPVLTTGSFTGKDTKVSIGSELVAVLDRGLSPPKSNAEQAAQEQLITQLLRASSSKLKTSPAFRSAIRNVIISNFPAFSRNFPGLGSLVDEILLLPLPDIYEWTRLPHVPDSVKKAVGITALQAGIRQVISTQVMKPLGRQLQTASLETPVSDTSLLKDLEENKTAAAGVWSNPEKEEAAKIAQLKGTTTEAVLAEKQVEATKRAAGLEATPEAVIAGPSHSQIAKDHPNSPFFGLAFLLATMAVRSIREKMVAAWDEKAGKATTLINSPPLLLTKTRRHSMTSVRRKRMSLSNVARRSSRKDATFPQRRTTLRPCARLRLTRFVKSPVRCVKLLLRLAR